MLGSILPIPTCLGQSDINQPTILAETVENDPYVWSGRALQEVSSTWQMRSCINVFGLRLEHVLRAIMDISARAF